ncbi:hypothetical protein DERF_002881 [Dermatophagoides farinae]|uniref:Uncharacterized protein n=1 Tax=Dermatophagoides farinae TaxID=6954 RepID=A0A922LA18_DERFA|nr:hypothetical protein DERF_002881 [Dermatophagoides farinae]
MTWTCTLIGTFLQASYLCGMCACSACYLLCCSRVYTFGQTRNPPFMTGTNDAIYFYNDEVIFSGIAFFPRQEFLESYIEARLK